MDVLIERIQGAIQIHLLRLSQRQLFLLEMVSQP